MGFIGKASESEIVWKEFTSEKDAQYEVGFVKESDAPEKEENTDGTKQDFGITCDWCPTDQESFLLKEVDC